VDGGMNLKAVLKIAYSNQKKVILVIVAFSADCHEVFSIVMP
jgi:protoheme ferro-lyase